MLLDTGEIPGSVRDSPSIVSATPLILAAPHAQRLAHYQMLLPLESLIWLFHADWTSATTSSGMGM